MFIKNKIVQGFKLDDLHEIRWKFNVTYLSRTFIFHDI